MVTKEQAMAALSEYHFGECRKVVGPRGGEKIYQTRVRASGRCQTWKTRPAEFRLPVKYGMYQNGEITHSNASQWHTPEDCPIR